MWSQHCAAQDYVNLGLRSGTLWKTYNESGLYSYDAAISKFGHSLSTKEQFEELKTDCKWAWNGNGYTVTGPNSESIVLPAEGIRYYDGKVRGVGSGGDYWSSTPDGSDVAWYLYFSSEWLGLNSSYRFLGRSVRLVKN